MDDWMKKTWYIYHTHIYTKIYIHIYIMGYYSLTKKGEILPFAT